VDLVPAKEDTGMNRRDAVAALGGAAVLWPLAARAQRSRKTRRLGVLMSLSPRDPEAQMRVAALETGLRERGWEIGRSLNVEYRWADNPDALRKHAMELLAMAPDLILANSTPVMAALMAAAPHGRQSVPIVFTQVTDPVGEGLVVSLAQPGGRLTGFTSFEYSIGTKWLELLKQAAPSLTRAALVFNPQTAPFAGLFWQRVEAAAPSFAIMPISAGAHTFAELEHMLEGFAREPNGGLIVLADVSTVNYRNAIIGLAARYRLPAVYPERIFAVDGGLLSYGSDVSDIFRRAAGYVDRILKGEKPADLPVQTPNKYELVINLKTAKALGLTMPPELLALANDVIE
jgi:putative tryptophan/tyrosine transport system substrate-binding protein